MGVNITIVDKNFNEHPDWDWMRYAGDREVDSILSSVGREEVMHGHWTDGMFRSRPHDVETLRTALSQHFDYNEERWKQMCDILEDPKWWLHFSY